MKTAQMETRTTAKFTSPLLLLLTKFTWLLERRIPLWKVCRGVRGYLIYLSVIESFFSCHGKHIVPNQYFHTLLLPLKIKKIEWSTVMYKICSLSAEVRFWMTFCCHIFISCDHVSRLTTWLDYTVLHHIFSSYSCYWYSVVRHYIEI